MQAIRVTGAAMLVTSPSTWCLICLVTCSCTPPYGILMSQSLTLLFAPSQNCEQALFEFNANYDKAAEKAKKVYSFGQNSGAKCKNCYAYVNAKVTHECCC